jgi:hypothetical protein
VLVSIVEIVVGPTYRNVNSLYRASLHFTPLVTRNVDNEGNKMVQRRRPFGVNVIAAMQILNGLTVAATIVLTDDFQMADLTLFEQIFTASFGVINIAVAVGLWLLKRWAWMFTMLWTGVNLAGGLVAYYQGEPNYFGMVFNIMIVFYLNQREVQYVFRPNFKTSTRSVNS